MELYNINKVMGIIIKFMAAVFLIILTDEKGFYSTDMAYSSMVCMMGSKVCKLPQVHLMYVFIFPDNLCYTSTNIVKHHFIIFALFFYNFIQTTVMLMHFHCGQLLYAILFLIIFGHSIFCLLG